MRKHNAPKTICQLIISKDKTIKNPNIELPIRIRNEHNTFAVADTLSIVIVITSEEFFCE